MMQEDIHTLMVRFLDGETTLEEERRLYAFFQREDVPEDLKDYQEMFRGFASIAPKQDCQKREAKRIPLWIRVASIAAACLLAVSLIGYTLYNNHTAIPQENRLKVQKPNPQPREEPKMVAEVKEEVKAEAKIIAEGKKEVGKKVEVKAEEEVTAEKNVEKTKVVEAEEKVMPTAIYASNETTDSTYQAPSRMDEFIAKFASYNEVKPVAQSCLQAKDTTVVIAAYVFPDTKELNVFGRLLQAACWYDDSTPGYHLNFSHLQFFFELKDERKGLKYLWIADRIDGKILLYSTHSPIGTAVSSECYQGLRDELMHVNSKATHQL
ncbi:MAG: hypothetical protein IJ693_05585 [Bacteroidaceae bacterium]|nr:hypothetical protein [Bacteroidaceae bacterium]